MVEVVRDGEVLGNEDEPDCWVVKDTVTGDEEEFDAEPTKTQVLSFKNEQGYSTVKVKKDARCKVIKITPLDKAGADIWIDW